MKKEITIVKIGGNVIDNSDLLSQILSDFTSLSGSKILIHGGGKLASELSSDLGIESQFHEGRRITSSGELKIVTMVYSGWINKSIVAELQSRGANALGLCGADGNVLQARKRSIAEVDFGHVGDIVNVNASFISKLLEQEIVPVFSAITHDGQGGLLNTNADTIACKIAQALVSEYTVKLIYCFEKQGVLFDENDSNSILPTISKPEFKSWSDNGILHSGILPKIQNCFDAKDAGVKEVHITHALNLHLLNPKTSFQ
ncbi:Acetylglutamate kinase [compost metagenome]